MAEQITEEQYLVYQIKRLQLEYARAAKPYIDRLARIQSLKPHPPMMFDLSKISKDMLEQINRKE